MRKLLGLFILVLAAVVSAPAQNGTQHGINLAWTASTTAGATYNVFRCTGTCTTSSTWPATPLNSAPITGTAYFDPASGLAAGTTYSYGVESVLSGEDSAFDITTVAVPSAGFPVNPAAPTAAAATVQ